MPRKLPEGWTWLQTQVKDEENELLDLHCKKVGRTKTEVIREFARSLADTEQDWKQDSSQRFHGEDRGVKVEAFNFLYDGWKIWLDEEHAGNIQATDAQHAITQAKAMVDEMLASTKHLISDEMITRSSIDTPLATLKAHVEKQATQIQQLLEQNERLLQALAELDNSEPDLPDGWRESEFNGKIEGTHLGCRVVLYPGSSGYEVIFPNGEFRAYAIPGVGAVAAIQETKELIAHWKGLEILEPNQ